MNLQDLREIDFQNVGEAPMGVKVLLVLILIAALCGAGYYFLIKDQRVELERAEARETQLRADFEDKQRRAANLDAYRAQLEEMEVMFIGLLQLLPSEAEIPGLLNDISQTALQAGLEIELFQPRQEIQRQFYNEVPIQVRLRGGYEQVANFVSGIAGLPRIVTVHDVHLRPVEGDAVLVMDGQVRTYRYREDAEK
ncbi:MAG: type 4a pilus biogenesis protein PilO [Thioalkalivibrionaceae bacterium]